jgi:hypothetical protein
MSDARNEGLSSEEYTARALREKKYDQLGGTSQNTCTTYTANLDLLSKQCVPGEQAVVFSVTELMLRMMGQSDICYTLQDDSTWEDIVGATVMCTLEEDDKDEAEEDEDAEAEAKETAEDAEDAEAAGGKTTYSDEFKSLVIGLRRRSFTQGGIDSVLDLHTARMLCQDFVSTHLTTTQDACEKKFADLFVEMLDVQNEEEEDEEDEDDEDDEKKGKWAELSEEEVKKYFVASIDNSVASEGSVRFKMVGLALREKQMVPDAEAAPGTDIYLKAP